MGVQRHFAPAFVAEVAGSPFSRAKDNEQELKGIQVEKAVNARTTHSWSREVYFKLCVVLFLCRRGHYHDFSPTSVWRNFPSRRVF